MPSSTRASFACETASSLKQLLLVGPGPDLLARSRGLDEVAHVEDLLDLVDLTLDLVARPSHRLEGPPLLLELLDERRGPLGEHRRELPLRALERLQRTGEVLLDAEVDVGIGQQPPDGADERLVGDLRESLLDLLDPSGDVRPGGGAKPDLERGEELARIGELAFLEELASMEDLVRDPVRQETALLRLVRDPVERDLLEREVRERLATERVHRFLEELARRLELDAVEHLGGPPKLVFERSGRELRRCEPLEERLQGLGLLAGGVEVLGELADPIDRLLTRGEGLAVDLEPERLPGPVHRREHLGGVAPESTCLHQARPHFVEQARHDGHDRLLGDLAGPVQETGELRRSGRADRGKDLLDLDEARRGVDPLLAQGRERRPERLDRRLDPVAEEVGDLRVLDLDGGDGVVPTGRDRLGVGLQRRLEVPGRDRQVAGRRHQSGPRDPACLATGLGEGELVRDDVVEPRHGLGEPARVDRIEDRPKSGVELCRSLARLP